MGISILTLGEIGSAVLRPPTMTRDSRDSRNTIGENEQALEYGGAILPKRCRIFVTS
jgi:hypothetical protein